MTGFLHQSPNEQLCLILYSLCLGVGVGIIYSFFDTISIILNLHIDTKRANFEKKLSSDKNKIIILKIFQFSIDFLFSVVYTIITVVFIFCANNGKFRFFVMMFAVLGFVLYKVTVGKAVNYLMCALFSYIKRLLSFIVISPLCHACVFMHGKIYGIKIKRKIFNTVSKDRDF